MENDYPQPEFTAHLQKTLEEFFDQTEEEILRQFEESLNDPFLKVLEAVERDHGPLLGLADEIEESND